MEAQQTNKPPVQVVGGAPRRGFVQNRMQNFGLTMIVMGASFIFYYMGLFGSVQGPLTPARIGERLAAAGFDNQDLLAGLLSCTVIAIVWNWMYNALCILLGRRRSCGCRLVEEKRVCGAPVRREAGGKTVCTAGHTDPETYFHAVKKGTLAHFAWMMFLVFSGMVFYLC